jgi:putative heme-binding domain-containing protein
MANRSNAILRRSFALGLSLAALCLLIINRSIDSLAAQQNSAATIAAGKRVYASSCGMSYCHGSEGSGGGGTKLRDRAFTPEYLTVVITEGIPGTIMPSFKDNLSKQQIASLVAYLMSISASKGAAKPASAQQAAAVDPHLNPAPAKPEPAPKPAAEPAKPKVAVNDSNDLFGDAEAGSTIFFDAAEIQNCRVCHTVQGRGGKVGPDLASLAGKPAREILQSIVAPHASVDERYATISITTKSGEKFTGVKRDEDQTTIRLYDTSSLPPVSRAFAKSEVAKIEKLNASPMPADYASKYSLKQLLDLVSFLKSSNVGLRELF